MTPDDNTNCDIRKYIDIWRLGRDAANRTFREAYRNTMTYQLRRASKALRHVARTAFGLTEGETT